MSTIAQAIRMSLHYGEKHLELKDVFGQDVGPPLGGVFTATQGLKTSWNTPLDERGIIGCALGIALTGQRCVAEIQFCDYIFNTIDLLKLAGNTLWASHGQYPVPLVVMTPVGSGIHGSIYHSHSFDAWASRLAGWKIVMPSNPLDAYGLMLSSLVDPNPVLYLKPKALMRMKGVEKIPGEPESEAELKKMIDAPIGDRSHWKPKWPDLKEHFVPLGQGRLVQEGDELTVVSYGRSLVLCEEALKKFSHSVELIDLRSIYPYDWNMIKTSVKKTKRVLFVNEDTDVTNFTEHLCYRTTRELFYDLLARPQVLAGKHLPGIGLAPELEDYSVPSIDDIQNAMNEIIREAP